LNKVCNIDFMPEVPHSGPRNNFPRRMRIRSAFTLVELLAVIGILALLAAILLPTISSMQKRARSAESLANVKSLAAAVAINAAENNNRFPKWGTATGSSAWMLELRPALGGASNQSVWRMPVFKDPLDNRPSPVGPGGHAIGWDLSLITTQRHDTAPSATARRSDPRPLAAIERPGSTILFGPFMWHTGEGWQDTADIQNRFERLGNKAAFAFVDGHAEFLSREDTYNPAENVNLWIGQR